MSKKAIFSITFLLVIACFVSFRFGSAPAVRAQSGLPTAPPTWTLWSGPPKMGNIASVTKAAGGVGVKHVATCVSGSINYWTSLTETGATFFVIQLLDGSNVIQEWGPVMMSGTISGFSGTYFYGHWSQCGLDITGSANTSMTLQITAHGSSTSAEVDLVGYDAQ